MKLKILFWIFLFLFFISYISAGVGIKWEQESFIMNEGEENCITYGVYNPWPEDSSVIIELSEELKNVLLSQKSETKVVPAFTSSSNALPIKFCFKLPKIYPRDCVLGSFGCKQECSGEQKIYEGEIRVKSVPNIDGVGGSATTMSVSAPLRIKVNCNESLRDFNFIYGILGIFSLILIIFLISKKYKKK